MNQKMVEMASHLTDAGYIVEERPGGVLHIVDRSYTGLTVDLMHAGCSSAPAAYWNQNRMGERWVKNNGQAQDRVKLTHKSGHKSRNTLRQSDY